MRRTPLYEVRAQRALESLRRARAVALDAEGDLACVVALENAPVPEIDAGRTGLDALPAAAAGDERERRRALLVAAIADGEHAARVQADELFLFLDVELAIVGVSAALADGNARAVHRRSIHVGASVYALCGVPGDVVGGRAGGAQVRAGVSQSCALDAEGKGARVVAEAVRISQVIYPGLAGRVAFLLAL